MEHHDSIADFKVLAPDLRFPLTLKTKPRTKGATCAVNGFPPDQQEKDRHAGGSMTVLLARSDGVCVAVPEGATRQNHRSGGPDIPFLTRWSHPEYVGKQGYIVSNIPLHIIIALFRLVFS